MNLLLETNVATDSVLAVCLSVSQEHSRSCTWPLSLVLGPLLPLFRRAGCTSPKATNSLVKPQSFWGKNWNWKLSLPPWLQSPCFSPTCCFLSHFSVLYPRIGIFQITLNCAKLHFLFNSKTTHLLLASGVSQKLECLWIGKCALAVCEVPWL